MTAGVVFLLDVDNTLIDSDHFIADLRRHLERELGGANAKRYWSMLEMLRAETGYVDYLGAFQRVAHETGHASATEARQVLIGPHKAQMLAIVERRFPARQYVMVDDKLRNLMAMKSVWRERLTTIFPRQGHDALDPAQGVGCVAADFTIDSIGELADVDLSPLTDAPAADVQTMREAA